jgi:hypothetical protein
MKRHPFLRILFLFVTLAAFFSAPFLMGNLPILPQTVAEDLPKVAGQPLIDAGVFFPVAGQDEVEASGIVLEAQEDAEIGELVRLDASASDVDGLTWQIIPQTPDFEVIEDGRRAFFSSRVPGSYLFIIAGAKGGVPYLEHHTLEVIGEEPDAPPKVENISGKVRRWAKGVGAYEARKVHALALAGVFRKLAEAEDVTVEDMLDATATANSAVLGDDLDKWLPLLEPLGEELDVLMEEGQLETREQYRSVWTDIADGIEKGVK